MNPKANHFIKEYYASATVVVVRVADGAGVRTRKLPYFRGFVHFFPEALVRFFSVRRFWVAAAVVVNCFLKWKSERASERPCVLRQDKGYRQSSILAGRYGVIKDSLEIYVWTLSFCVHFHQWGNTVQ